ncbi:TRAP transporter small permease [Salinarimonas sp. NSM]|uniref:TRAP transporter small permease n=1 Tax=Salinarimonas sp. NSM TaxID=3458003 RepID=UPI004036CA01
MTATTTRRPTAALSAVGALLERACGAVAVLGGIALLGMIAVSVVSITGRSILPGLAGLVGLEFRAASIPGDIELVQIGTGIAVFSFLPFCQLRRGNVLVDFFTSGAALRVRAALDLVGNLIFTVLAGLIAWRLVLGLQDKLAYNDTTMVLRLPEAYPFAFGVACAWLLAIVCAYTVWRSAEEIRANRPIGPHDVAEH